MPDIRFLRQSWRPEQMPNRDRRSLLRREFVLLSAFASLDMPENRKDRPPDEPKGWQGEG